jgi:hypothetical protein
MAKYNRFVTKGLANIIIKPVAKFVNSFDGEQPHQDIPREPMTKDKFIYSAFGGTGYKYLSDEGKEKYWLDYFNQINPPKEELTEKQKFNKDPKAYLDEYFSNRLNKVDENEDKL